MPDIAILRQLIKESARLPLNDVYGKKKVILTEAQSTDSKVDIVGLPPDAIVIKIDEFPAPDKLLSGSKGECKRADFAIIAESGGKKRILYIEMKRTKDSGKDIILQLKGAECLLAYCIRIAETFYGADNFLQDYEPRFISFGHTAIRKRKTRITRKVKRHDSPELMMKVDWPVRMEYNHLAGA